MRGVFVARMSSRGFTVEVCDDLLIGATSFGGKYEFPGCEVKGVADAL